MERRTILKGAAWSIPVIAAAVAAPVTAASDVPQQRTPAMCTQINKSGTEWYLIAYDDNTTETLSKGEVQRDKVLREMCS